MPIEDFVVQSTSEGNEYQTQTAYKSEAGQYAAQTPSPAANKGGQSSDGSLWHHLSSRLQSARSESGSHLGVLPGCTLHISSHLDEAGKTYCRQAAAFLGANVCSNEEEQERPTHWVCEWTDEAASSSGCTVVTVDWLDACIAARSAVPTAPAAASNKSTITANLQRIDQLLATPSPVAPEGGVLLDCYVSVSGFSSSTRPSQEQLKRLIRRLGGCNIGPLSRQYTTHLVCMRAGGTKLASARAWNAEYERKRKQSHGAEEARPSAPRSQA